MFACDRNACNCKQQLSFRTNVACVGSAFNIMVRERYRFFHYLNNDKEKFDVSSEVPTSGS